MAERGVSMEEYQIVQKPICTKDRLHGSPMWTADAAMDTDTYRNSYSIIQWV